MSLRAYQLAERRQALQARSAEQRRDIAADIAGLEPVFSTVDALRRAAQWLRHNPEWVVGGVAVVVVVKPKRSFRMARRAMRKLRLAPATAGFS